jgi:hypothetical protein
MTTYTATYRSPVRFAEHDIDAATADEALAQARAFYDADPFALDWQSYECDASPDEIEINGPEDGDTAFWQRDDLRLSVVASDLRDALTALIEQIDSLHGESSCIDEDIQEGEPYRQACSLIASFKQ